jgi:colicin import membrane protein
MADKEESSVLFSLQELMSLEEERIADEEAATEAASQAEQARLDAEARAQREAEEARIRAEEETRRAEELRRREDEARVVAAAQAEIDKAKAETDNKARLEQIAQAQGHEQKLAEIKQDKSKKKLQIFLAVAAVAILGIAGGFIAYQKKQTEETAKKELAFQLELEEAKKAADEQVQKLERELENNKDITDAERRKLKKQIEDAKKAADKAGKDKKSGSPRRSGGRTGGGSSKPKPKKPSGGCAPGDPLCGGF